ncbi:MAG: phosphocholine cytidylyltransferase family protein [Thiohalomonadales bacterium]
MSNSCLDANTTKITTALLLAAGTGTRLQPLTLDAPKCLTEVGGIPILERLINNLRAQGFKRLIVVIGHLGDCIRDYLQQNVSDIHVDYVINPDYRTTNNLYSLWLAREQVHESFLLVESDLVFEPWMLDDMLQPNKIAISKILPWMNGTTVELGIAPGLERRVSAFRTGDDIIDAVRQYKTVNICSLSINSWNKIEKTLSHYVEQGRLGEYYEAVFAEMVANGTLSFEAVLFDPERWYEIDTRADLKEAEAMLTRRPSSSSIKHPALLVSEAAAALA